MTKVIAFMFLGGINGNYQTNNVLNIWKNFFDNADPAKYMVIVHERGQPLRNQTAANAKKLTMNFRHPEKVHVLHSHSHLRTSWGSSSLATAAILMIQKAWKTDENVYKFVLVDQSQIPLYNFDVIYNKLTENDKCWLHTMDLKKDRDRFESFFTTYETLMQRTGNNFSRILKHNNFNKRNKHVLNTTAKAALSTNELDYPGMFSQFFAINKIYASALLFDKSVIMSFYRAGQRAPSYREIYGRKKVWTKSNVATLRAEFANWRAELLMQNNNVIGKSANLTGHSGNIVSNMNTRKLILGSQQRYTDEILLGIIRFILGKRIFNKYVHTRDVTKEDYKLIHKIKKSYAHKEQYFAINDLGNGPQMLIYYLPPVTSTTMKSNMHLYTKELQSGMKHLVVKEKMSLTVPSTYTYWGAYGIVPDNVLRNCLDNIYYTPPGAESIKIKQYLLDVDWSGTSEATIEGQLDRNMKLHLENGRRLDAHSNADFHIQMLANGKVPFYHPLEWKLLTVKELYNTYCLIRYLFTKQRFNGRRIKNQINRWINSSGNNWGYGQIYQNIIYAYKQWHKLFTTHPVETQKFPQAGNLQVNTSGRRFLMSDRYITYNGAVKRPQDLLIGNPFHDMDMYIGRMTGALFARKIDANAVSYQQWNRVWRTHSYKQIPDNGVNRNSNLVNKSHRNYKTYNSNELKKYKKILSNQYMYNEYLGNGKKNITIANARYKGKWIRNRYFRRQNINNNM